MSEQRLIDANALVMELLTITYLGCDGGYYKGRADERDGILQRIQAAPTIEPKRGEWISVKDRLPENSDFDADGYILVCANGRIDFDKKGFGYYKDTVTHWMPLPEPPADMRKE